MRSLVLLASDAIVDQLGRPTLAYRGKWQQLIQPEVLAVADLPANAPIGTEIYASDLRVFNGTGTRETAGNGTGGKVTWNGSNWVIAGTNVTAVA